MSPLRVHVRLLGAFRKYEANELTLELPRGTRVATLRRRLADALRLRCPTFADEALLDVSVLADEHRVLEDADLLDASPGRLSLAVLPPVWGG
jgi:hypothetical protein